MKATASASRRADVGTLTGVAEGIGVSVLVSVGAGVFVDVGVGVFVGVFVGVGAGVTAPQPAVLIIIRIMMMAVKRWWGVFAIMVFSILCVAIGKCRTAKLRNAD